MCLIAFAWQADARYLLVVAANRDEFRARPTAPLAFWSDQPELLAGRDLAAGGTWMGITRSGRFAALTNIRDGRIAHAAPRSRGELVVDALLQRASADKSNYSGYNLVAGDLRSGTLVIDGNRAQQQPRVLGPGIYGLSNGALDEPWPKTVRAKAQLHTALADLDGPIDRLITRLLDALDDRRGAADEALPDTGVGLARERGLAPIRIDLPDYGTRMSTVLVVSRQGQVVMTEHSHDTAGMPPVTQSFMLAPAARGAVLSIA